MANGMEKTAIVLSAVGAINWGLVAFLNFNVVEKINLFPQVIYGIVAAAGIFALYSTFKK